MSQQQALVLARSGHREQAMMMWHARDRTAQQIGHSGNSRAV